MKAELSKLLSEKLKRDAPKRLLAFTKYTLGTFEENWHHAVIAELVEKLDARADFNGHRLDRLMIFAPPRHTKSEIGTVRRPAWSIGRDRRRQFMVIAYGGDLARTFSKGVRNILKGRRAQTLWPDLAFKTEADTRWQIQRIAEADNEKDSMIAAGVGGGLTGEGATDVIIDDPFKNQQEAYSKAARDNVWNQYVTSIRTRLQPGGSVALTLTRWHDDDIAGRLLKEAAKDKRADQWVVLCLPATNDDGKSAYVLDTHTGEKVFFPPYAALWPKWHPRTDLERTRISIGPTFWSAMYQQAPVAAQGSIFLRSAWKYFSALPPIERFVQIYDTAYGEKQENDYSVGADMLATSAGYAIADVFRGQISFPKLVEQVYVRFEAAGRRYGLHPERVLVEEKGSGISLIQQLEANNLAGCWTYPDGTTRPVPFIPVLGMPATQSKELRAHGVSGYQNAGLCLLPERADWLEDWLDEHSAFPKGANDDQVDVFVHGLTYWTRPVDGAEAEQIVATYGDEYRISGDLDELEMSSW